MFGVLGTLIPPGLEPVSGAMPEPLGDIPSRLAENGRFSLFFNDFTVIRRLGFPGQEPGPVRRQAE